MPRSEFAAIRKAVKGKKPPKADQQNHRFSPAAKARLGQGQHPVLLVFEDGKTGERVEELFDTGPLAVASAHQRGISTYEIHDA